MKRITMKYWLILSTLFLTLFFYSCSKENGGEDINPIPENIRAANEFAADFMNNGYLWNDKIPLGIDPQKEEDPIAMVKKMVNKDLDRWTYLTDEAEEAMGSFQGVNTTFGYDLAFGQFTNTNNLFAIIKYVLAGSPAEKAGLKRGNIIISFANGDITEENYLDLLYSTNISIKLGKNTDKGISPIGDPISLTAIKMYEDPVNEYKIIDKNGIKIGYLAYTGYLKESHEKLDDVFTNFKNAGVTEIVLDLRYNPGGNALTPPYLASFLAPTANVVKGDVFLKQVWNTNYMAYYAKEGTDLHTYFNKNCIANLNLKRVFILTTSGTASASEATISGLKPYLDVITIGTTTHGKYCGAALLQPTLSDGKTLDPLIKNWLLSMVIYKFVNTAGFTDFKDGIAPKYEVKDNLLAAVPFGDITDAHFAKAISIITGSVKSATKAVQPTLIEGRDYVVRKDLTDKLNKDYGNTSIITLP